MFFIQKLNYQGKSPQLRVNSFYNMKVNVCASGGEHKETSNLGSVWSTPELAVGKTQTKKAGPGGVCETYISRTHTGFR